MIFGFVSLVPTIAYQATQDLILLRLATLTVVMVIGFLAGYEAQGYGGLHTLAGALTVVVITSAVAWGLSTQPGWLRVRRILAREMNKERLPLRLDESEVDTEILAGHRIRALQAIMDLRGCELQEAVEILIARYDELRVGRPRDFAENHETYWASFYA